MYDARTRNAALRRLSAGASLARVSTESGIQRSTLRRWRASPPITGECPRCEEATLPHRPYAALLGFYLGDGCISRERRSHSLRISCDAALPGIVLDASGVMQAVRPSGTVFHVRAPGTVVVHGSWKHWPCLFPQHGPGRKHERPIVLEPWQREVVAQHPAAFLRGLFHSDGSRTRNWATRRVGGEVRRYEYPRWEFANRSADIIDLCCWALEVVGVDHRLRRPDRVAVSRREAVARLDSLIGPKR